MFFSWSCCNSQYLKIFLSAEAFVSFDNFTTQWYPIQSLITTEALNLWNTKNPTLLYWQNLFTLEIIQKFHLFLTNFLLRERGGGWVVPGLRMLCIQFLANHFKLKQITLIVFSRKLQCTIRFRDDYKGIIPLSKIPISSFYKLQYKSEQNQQFRNTWICIYDGHGARHFTLWQHLSNLFAQAFILPSPKKAHKI